MARVNTCDCCGKVIDEDNPIVAKLFLSPVNGAKNRDVFNRYSNHMDVGKCCLVRVQQVGKWNRRKPRPRKVA